MFSCPTGLERTRTQVSYGSSRGAASGFYRGQDCASIGQADVSAHQAAACAQQLSAGCEPFRLDSRRERLSDDPLSLWRNSARRRRGRLSHAPAAHFASQISMSQNPEAGSDHEVPKGSARTRGAVLGRRLVVIGLAGLLIFHHTAVLYDQHLGDGTLYDLYNRDAVDSALATIEYLQTALRVVIVFSLLFTVFGARAALWGMWAGITGLIATQYWAHFGELPVNFTEGRHPLSYLRGFIFPSIITFMTRLTTSSSARDQPDGLAR